MNGENLEDLRQRWDMELSAVVVEVVLWEGLLFLCPPEVGCFWPAWIGDWSKQSGPTSSCLGCQQLGVILDKLFLCLSFLL